MYNEFMVDQYKVTVHDEYGDSWILWFNTIEEVNQRVDEYPGYNYIIEEMGKVTMGMMLSLDAGRTYEISWLANDLIQSQIDAYLSSNQNYIIGLVYSGKPCQLISEETFKKELNNFLKSELY